MHIILVAERDSLVAERDSLVSERDAAIAERDELKAQLAEMHQKSASTVIEGECWAAPSLSGPLRGARHISARVHSTSVATDV